MGDAMQTYEDGTKAKIGDVVMGDGRPARYIVVGFEGYSAKLVAIGTVTKSDAALFGKTIFIQPGFTKSAPLSGFTRLGYAEIEIVEGSMPSNVGDSEEHTVDGERVAIPNRIEDRDVSSIYLYKPPETENFTNMWVYYRVDSINGPDEPAGTMFAPIQICKVLWPTFADIKPLTDTGGTTGLESAHEQVCRMAKSLWGVEHEKSTFIGFLEVEGRRF